MSADRSSPIERMYFAWDDALSRNDAAGLLALYAPDAVFESPWCRIFSAPRAVCCAVMRS